MAQRSDQHETRPPDPPIHLDIGEGRPEVDPPPNTFRTGFDLNAPLILVIGLAGAIWLFVAVVGLEALSYSLENRLIEKNVVNQPVRELQQHRLEEESRIRQYGYIDRENGVVSIPIDRAISLYARRGEADGKPASTP
jgi:hypothetical protein